MDNEQIGTGGGGHFDGGEGGVHGGGDPGDGAGVFDLQSVGRALVVIKHCGPQAFLAMCHHGGQRRFWHEGMKTETAGIFKRARRKFLQRFGFTNPLLNFARRFLYCATV
jgi:hypothetical protein